jgi:putative addiction module killer protein
LLLIKQHGGSAMKQKVDKPQIVLHKGQEIRILQTPDFRDWLRELRDRKARLRIGERIDRLVSGNFGDAKSVGDGVQELRMRFGPGYRIYYIWRGDVLIILLNGGDKDSQVRDIAKAKRMAKEIGNGGETSPL